MKKGKGEMGRYRSGTTRDHSAAKRTPKGADSTKTGGKSMSKDSKSCKTFP